MNSVSGYFPSTRRRQAGFSMVEVLVSIIVLSFGLLGMVGLQAAALKGNREARLQSVATGLARELAEMMRGNKTVAISTDATVNFYLADVCQTGCTSTSYPTSNALYCLNVGGTGCANGTELAKAQMTEWVTRVNAELPGARIKVCQDSAPYDASGLPQWNCTASAGGDVIAIKIGWTRSATNRGAATAASSIELASGTSAARPGIVLTVTSGVDK